MKYLFFDCEFSSCRKLITICEFGYVLTDDKFNIIESNNLIINPNIKLSEWDNYTVNNILKRSIKYYELNPLFSFYYEKIKSLLEESDYIFGHSLDCDSKAINDELVRYNYNSINYNFIDVKLLYKEYSHDINDTSLINMCKNLNVNCDLNFHDAQVDSYNTMLCLKELVKLLNIEVKDIENKYPNCLDKVYDYKVDSIIRNEEIKRIREEKYHKEMEELINKYNKESHKDLDNTMNSLFDGLDLSDYE